MSGSSGPEAAAANARGIALMVSGILVLTVMDAMIKWLSSDYHSLQIIFFRCAFAMLPIFAIAAFSGGLGSLRTRRPGAQALRAAVGLATMVLFFLALKFMPLAEATVLAFASPLFVTALSVPLLGERVGWRRLAAVVVGFLGVVIILRPGTAVFSPYAVLPVAASFFFALGMVLARRLSVTESSIAIVFYTTLAGLLVGAASLPAVWVTPAAEDLPVLVVLGLLGGLGQFLITAAFRHAAVAVVAPFEYSALIWATLLGFMLWGELPDLPTVGGAAVLTAAGLFIVYRETRVPRAGEER